MSSTTRDVVIYVTGTYPMLTTTFIDREIRMLRSRGVDIEVVSLRRPATQVSPEQQLLAASTTYVRPVSRSKLVRRHMAFLGRSPRRYLSALRHLVSGAGQTPRDRLRSAGHFGLAVHVAGEIAEGGKPRHVHAHFIDRAAAVTLVVARLLDVPYSITAHASDIYVDPVLLGEKIGGARFVTTCTAHNRDHLVETVAAAGSKVELLYHGLELDDYRRSEPARENTPDLLAVGDRAPTLLAVGQLREKKGFHHLIDACRLLADAGVDFRCEIVGEGPQRPTLEAKIRDLGLDRHVLLRGALPHGEVIDAYRRARAFVLPCVVAENGDRDGIPNVILEAMAMQLPVVSTTVSGVPEAVAHRETGLLVAPGDSEGLAVALNALLADPSAAAEMGRNGRQVVERRFDAATNVETLFQRFTSVPVAS